MFRVVALSLALTSCYAPDLADCAVTCGADRDCGGGQVCTAGTCAREGITCTAIPGVDAPASVVDASDPDAPHIPDSSDAPVTTLRVKIKDLGRVTPDGFAACTTGECLYQLPAGQPIALTAVPAANRIFEKWEDACTGQLTPVCTITPTGPAETRATAKFKKPGPGGEDDD